MRLAHVRKAVTAAAATAVAALGTGLLDGDLQDREIVAAIGAGLVAGAATYQIPNRRTEP